MLKCIELDEKLKSMDQEITVNPQFVQKVRQLVCVECVNGKFSQFRLVSCIVHVHARNTLNITEEQKKTCIGKYKIS